MSGDAGTVAAVEAGANVSAPAEVPPLGAMAAVDGATVETAALAHGGQVAGLKAQDALSPALAPGADIGIGTVLSMKTLTPAAFLRLDPLLTVVDERPAGRHAVRGGDGGVVCLV